MRRLLDALLVAAATVMIPLPAFAADEVSVSEVVEMAAGLAGREISVEGELVGDYGFRADGSMWSQLNGDPYVTAPLREVGSPVGGNVGIGVRIPADLAVGLDPPGGYRHRGPVVLVTGIWRYHDPARQGESYLDVHSVVLVEPGRPLEEGENWIAAMVGGMLLIGAGAVGLRARSKDDVL